MRTLRLFAIPIDDVRDLFRASPDLADRLRGISAATFPPPPPPRRVGLFRREPALVVDPAQPQRGDVDALLSGSYVAPDRLVASWRLLVAWLDELAAGRADIVLQDADAIEFDLARAGLPSDYAVGKLAGRDLGIPLRGLPDQVAGYAKHVQAVETGEHLEHLTLTSSDEFGPLLEQLRPVRQVLGHVTADPRLDLVVVQTDQLRAGP